MPKFKRAGDVAGGEDGAVAQVHHPFPGLDPAPELVRSRHRRQRQVRCGRSGGVGRRHVDVVGGEDVQAGEQLGDVGFLVVGQGRIVLLLRTDGGLGGVGLVGGAEAAEAVGGEHLSGIRQLRGELMRGGVLGVDQVLGVLVPEQVGSSGRAEEQRAAGEHRHRLPAGGQGVGEVAERVSGRGQSLQPHRRPDSTSSPSAMGVRS